MAFEFGHPLHNLLGGQNFISRSSTFGGAWIVATLRASVPFFIAHWSIRHRSRWAWPTVRGESPCPIRAPCHCCTRCRWHRTARPFFVGWFSLARRPEVDNRLGSKPTLLRGSLACVGLRVT